MVLGLSTRSSSSSHPSTSMTPSRLESNRSTSSSSSSTSPTTTSSGSETPDRENASGIDSHPVPVSSSNVEEIIERGDPLFATNIGSAPKPTNNPKTNKKETTIERGDPLCKGNVPCTSYSRTFTIHKYGYGTAYIFTHNKNMLEHIANNGTDTTKHTDVYNAQF